MGLPQHERVNPPAGPRSPHYLSLDLWRGVACLMVAVSHSTLYVTQGTGTPVFVAGHSAIESIVAATTRLWAGVPLFFVISGYCICAAADSARRKGTPIGVYFLRRVRRIFPPYWIILGLTILTISMIEAFIWPTLFYDDWYSPGRFSAFQRISASNLTDSL